MIEKPLRVQIASPCTERWDEMAGDERVRTCALCQLRVYNLSAMRSGEARALVEQLEGRVCVRFFQRADGTVMTADCPVRRLKRSRRFVAAWTAAAIGIGFLAVAGAELASSSSSAETSTEVSPLSQVAFPDWAKQPLPKHKEFRPQVAPFGRLDPLWSREHGLPIMGGMGLGSKKDKKADW